MAIRTQANAMVTIGTVVVVFMIFAAGMTIVIDLASTVVLSQADQAARDVSMLMVLSKGIPGISVLHYTIPRGSTLSGSERLTFEFTPEELSVTDEEGFVKPFFLPYTSFPSDWEVNGIPRSAEEAKKIKIEAESGRIENIIKVE